MKHYSTFLYLFLLLFCLNACDEDDDQPDEPNYGIEFFECKINGEPFQAISIPFQCSGPRFDYYPEPFAGMPQGYMLLAGKDCYNSPLCAIRIYGYQGQLGMLNFNNPAIADSVSPFYSYFDDNEPEGIIRENLVDGYVHIEQLVPRESGNSPLGTIKGTFEFTVTDELGIDTIDITDGSFRFDVPQIF